MGSSPLWPTILESSNMKITKVYKITSYIVDTDEGYWNTYRRNGSENWEQLMGESWEGCYSQEAELEQLFQEYKKCRS